MNQPPAFLQHPTLAQAVLSAQSDKRGLFLAVEGKLSGKEIPIVVKDTLCTLTLPTTCASRILEGYVSPFEATVVSRLREAGCQVVAKANCDEFAMGSSTETGAWGPAQNPWDTHRVCGGSSGGSAGAVAAGIVPIALGSDTGGSVRQPASFCGVVGFRPTWGRVSRYGLVAMTSSMDTVGVLANTVETTRWTFDQMCGIDKKDATSLAVEEAPPPTPEAPRVVWIPSGEEWKKGVSSEVLDAFSEGVKAWEKGGVEVREVPLAFVEALAAYYVICYAEVSTNLSRFDGIRFGESKGMTPADWRGKALGSEVKRRILMGCQVLSSGYKEEIYQKACGLRQSLAMELGSLTEQGPLFLPTTPQTAFKRGSVVDALEMHHYDLFTTPASLAGLPAVSIPWTLSKKGLPIGLQLVGKKGGDESLLNGALCLEELSPWETGRVAP
ncbi:Asp-tRNA(Asn)/Glu-tRNA(Gln) amidotransferase subunit GatA [bacterium]|nr:Asp-tRNA(Asn)/Glu-tRNA(Gln) amidotransferase subunit GatA [bacterium]